MYIEPIGVNKLNNDCVRIPRKSKRFCDTGRKFPSKDKMIANKHNLFKLRFI